MIDAVCCRSVQAAVLEGIAVHTVHVPSCRARVRNRHIDAVSHVLEIVDSHLHHANPVGLPDAIAYRRLIGGRFLEERMIGPPQSADAFTRISFLDYNSMSGRYEYFSIDTRLPQMMNERSSGPTMTQGMIELDGGIFVAPRWGSTANVPFRYRILVGPVQGGSQTVELYLTPLPAGHNQGFLAFKYIYTRHAGTAAR